MPRRAPLRPASRAVTAGRLPRARLATTAPSRVAAVAAALAVAATAVACGGGTEPGTAAGPSGPAASSGATSPTSAGTSRSTGGPGPSSTTGGGPTSSAGGPTTTAKGSLATVAPWKLDKPWTRGVALPDGDQILLYSGLNSAKQSLKRVVRINPTTGAITELPSLPEVLHDAAGARIGDAAVLIGGGEQDKASNRVTAVTGDRAGQQLGTIDVGRSDLVAATVDGTTYVFGGYDEKVITPAVLASRDGRDWKAVTDLPVPVRYPAMAVLDGKVYLFGGKLASGQTDAIQRFDPATGKAEVVGHADGPFGHSVAFTIDGTAYVAGGQVSGKGGAETATDALWRFDAGANRLVRVGTLPYAVSDLPAVVQGGVAYLLGGENTQALATVIEVRP